MYLKKLTLRGFKSFASATTLVFEPGITCVVGPNGSGKSNVVDALSWVMGEQGAKTLRGGKMEDVIFAGTATRAPLGRAEVELTIDNSDGALPIEYTEVTITRTMFRSGGSEYAINGTTARLLDVQELLSDSGIGREMHVIVGQGQLDAILSATPESRRGFVEEAAGVLKHRKRKERALRKLEATKSNMERIGDLVAELRRQLKPLGRQAEAARKAAVVQAELRDAKARLLADDLAEARRSLAADLADEREQAEAVARAEAAVRGASAAEDQAEERLRESAREFDRAQEGYYALAGLRERVATTRSIAAERARLGTEPVQTSTGGRDPDALERDAGEIRARERELRAAAEVARERLRVAAEVRTAAEGRHAAAERAYSAALRAVADRREGRARLAGRVSSARSRVEAAEEEIGRLRERRAESLERAARAADRYRGTETSLADLGHSESSLDADYEAALAAADALDADLAELRSAEAEKQRAKTGLDARVDALRLLTERRDGAAALRERDPALRSLSGLIVVEEGWEGAVAAALGAAAEAVVVEDLSRAGTALGELAEGDWGRATLLVAGAPHAPAPASGPGRPASASVSAPPELRGALSWLLRDVVLVDDAAAAQALVADRPELTAVTRAGEVFSAWLVAGGSAEGPSLLEVRARLATAEEEAAGLGHELDRLRFLAEGLSGRLAEAREREQELLARLHASDAELAAVADRLNALRQAQAAAEREADRHAAAIEAAEAGLATARAALAELEARLAEVESEGEVAEPDPSERDALAVTARLARQKEMDERLAVSAAEEQAKSLTGRAEALLRAARHERDARAKAKARVERRQAEARIAEAVRDVATELAVRVEAACGLAREAREAADRARGAAESAAAEARRAAKAAAARFDELQRGAHRDEMARIERRMRVEQLEDKAMADLGLEPDALLAEYGPELPVPVLTRPDGAALTEDDETPDPVPYDRAAQLARLRRAERALAQLGRVNPLALEEFDAMSARHQFLAEQLDDLHRTRADLMEIVAEVDARVQEVFEAAYTDVERAFTEVFSRLFPGGEGRLVLTEPGNWLTTGIDVEARPAGKQVKRLSLLSGGERSLVAVAFLFALFIARPSPFYILDEVEAALDDTNLGRLLTIYEELRANSQLLVITHQKRTMEIADSLYGVTMHGDGISTVVSQRL
ncbi:MAG TPA: chromosome segregation protein SMC [Arachnia sp.]|nr:chromosome segregation protein SMC [Arachnia sp.]HMT84730.1 chromosome segregation protein SMC [Arachnia sp.]